VQSESINSIEIAVGAATFVLGTRLFSLIQATRGVPSAHRQVLADVASGDLGALENRARGIRYVNPYGEAASDLVNASQREGTPEKRIEHLGRSALIAEKRIIRSTQQGQGMDIAALAVGCGILVFAREALPTGPLFWSLMGAMMILLLASVVARGALKLSILGSVEALRKTLVSRPQLPSFSGGPMPCLWCGGKTEQAPYTLSKLNSPESETIQGTSCAECGKFVATLDCELSSRPAPSSHPASD